MKKIKFSAPYSSQPYEVVKYLQGFGVKCKPLAKVIWLEDGDRICSLEVSSGQYKWAIGLIQGYKNYRVITNDPVKPIKPKSRWHEYSVSSSGILGKVFSVLDKFFDVEVDLPQGKKK